MKFFSLIKFDFIYGTVRNYKKIILLALLILFSCFAFRNLITSFEITDFTLGDCMFYIYGGMKEYIPSPSEAFPIPYMWLLNNLLMLFFTLHYMYDDLTHFGQNVIYRCKSRFAWWFSKCLWNISVTMLFYITEWVIIFIFSLFSGAEMTLKISSFIPQFIDFGGNQIVTDNYNLAVELLLLPLFVTISCSLLQMMLCFIIKPTFSFIVSVIVYVSSAYYLSPYLIGNYAMTVRSNEVITNGVNSFTGIIFAVGLTVFSIAAGAMIFRKYSILNSKE